MLFSPATINIKYLLYLKLINVNKIPKQQIVHASDILEYYIITTLWYEKCCAL